MRKSGRGPTIEAQPLNVSHYNLIKPPEQNHLPREAPGGYKKTSSVAWSLQNSVISGITVQTMQTVQFSTTDSRRINHLMEKVLGITKAREEFSTMIEKVQHQGDSYVISRHGKPAAAVVPIQVYEEWKRQRNEFFELVRRAQQEADLTPEEADRIAAEGVEADRAERQPEL